MLSSVHQFTDFNVLLTCPSPQHIPRSLDHMHLLLLDDVDHDVAAPVASTYTGEDLLRAPDKSIYFATVFYIVFYSAYIYVYTDNASQRTSFVNVLLILDLLCLTLLSSLITALLL